MVCELITCVVKVQTRSMTRNRNYDASNRKMMSTCGGVSWADLNHDLLYTVMMQLGVVDFLSFSGVFKSWRSLALANRKRFMASRPPMLMYLSHKMTLYLEDFEGRKFRTLIPEFVGRECVGLSCGYLILFGQQTHDFWLVNPITRHELHFPNVNFDVIKETVRAVLVFSPSINGWVIVMTSEADYEIWFSIAGKGAWNLVSSEQCICILDLHVFKGKIYALHFTMTYEVCELTLNPVPKLTPIDTHYQDSVSYIDSFISSDENLYLMEGDVFKVHKRGFDQLNWAPCEKTRQECAVFHSHFKFSAVVKPESWAPPSSQYARFFDTKKRGQDRYYVALAHWWYFPHDCLNVNLIDE